MTRSAGKAGRREGIAIARETMDPIFEFIDEHLGQPFLVWFAPQLPHLPHDPPQRLRNSYKGLGLPWFAPGYYASVTWFDESVGLLVEHLEKRGLRERTLIVYLADNGWQAPADGVDYDFVLGGAHGKLSLHELGFRTPVIFNQPGRIAPGRSETELVSSVDLFPTLLGIAGATVPPSREGRDLRPAVEAGTPGPRDVLIGTAATLRTDRPEQPAGGAFLRDHRWHYLWYNDGREALFDLEADPDEQRDVAALQRERVLDFRRRITAWVGARTDAAERGASDPAAY
jgi:uncharacterized sulfatase